MEGNAERLEVRVQQLQASCTQKEAQLQVPGLAFSLAPLHVIIWCIACDNAVSGKCGKYGCLRVAVSLSVIPNRAGLSSPRCCVIVCAHAAVSHDSVWLGLPQRPLHPVMGCVVSSMGCGMHSYSHVAMWTEMLIPWVNLSLPHLVMLTVFQESLDMPGRNRSERTLRRRVQRTMSMPAISPIFASLACP